MRILLLLLLFSWANHGLAATENPDSGPMALQAMVGESFAYDIDFLWFNRLAEGNFRLEAGDHPGIYRAVLEARTLGVAAWLTRHRLQRYISIMKLLPNGQLQSLTHDSYIEKGTGSSRKARTKRYTFDHENRKVLVSKADGGVFEDDNSFNLPEKGNYSDFLTVFFNLRLGVYGPVEPGNLLIVPTFSRKGITDIKIEVLDSEAREKYKFFSSGGLLAKIKMDPEIFKTGDGDVLVWFDGAGRPMRGIIEDVIGMGDVRGYLQGTKERP